MLKSPTNLLMGFAKKFITKQDIDETQVIRPKIRKYIIVYHGFVALIKTY